METASKGRFTRRQIMGGAAAAAVAAMATNTSQASAQGGSRYPDAKNECATMPADQLAAVGAKAADQFPGTDKAKFERIAEVLWCYFALGVERMSNDTVQIVDSDDLPMVAYEKGTGAAVARNMAGVSPHPGYPEDGQHPITNFCAYRCGEHAARLAMYLGQNRVTPDTFRNAWEATRIEMGEKLARIRAARQERGEEVEEGTAGIGLGC